MEKKETNKKAVVLSIIGLVALVMIVVGVTYAAYTYSKAGTQTNQLTTGTITMVYTEGANGISITDALPMSDENGKVIPASTTGNVFDFTVTVNITGKMAVKFEVTAQKAASSTLGNNDVKLYLERCTDGTSYEEIMAPSHFTPISASAGTDTYGADNSEMRMDTETTQTTVTYYYRLRMWVDENYSMGEESKSFTVTVNVYGKDSTYENIDASQVDYGDTSVAAALDELHGA